MTSNEQTGTFMPPETTVNIVAGDMSGFAQQAALAMMARTFLCGCDDAQPMAQLDIQVDEKTVRARSAELFGDYLLVRATDPEETQHYAFLFPESVAEHASWKPCAPVLELTDETFYSEPSEALFVRLMVG